LSKYHCVWEGKAQFEKGLNYLIYTTKENTFTISDVNPLDVLLQQDYVRKVLDFLGDKVTIKDHLKSRTRSYTRHYYEKDAPDESFTFTDELELPEMSTEGDFQAKVISCFDGGCKLDGKQYKWCGLGCGGGDPINKLDSCCRTHDICYGNFDTIKDMI